MIVRYRISEITVSGFHCRYRKNTDLICFYFTNRFVFMPKNEITFGCKCGISIFSHVKFEVFARVKVESSYVGACRFYNQYIAGT